MKKALLIAGVLVAAASQAVVLNPGQTAVPTGVAWAGISESLVAADSETFTGLDAFNNVIFTGTLYFDVWSDNVTGNLSFYYRIVNDATSSTSITTASMRDFAGFSTDADYLNDLFYGVVNPTLVSRDNSGSNVNFSFISGPIGAGEILPGQDSMVLRIATDAKQYTDGSTALLNGGIAAVQTYAPVPEPATMVILGGAAALAAARRRKNA